ncbi:serine hydroxymethyltransferase [Paenibacillus xylaniclasticus]|uniref:serine hydroxymethyltransferase n=1 Tax=Paenibacillus xylaniclasticus TaxID=588083 RepID=UPI000FD6D6BF|nr:MULTISPECIES: serine hydroxymethyltransferase [Paenibacillus]GFN32214.1 serine hydroxymethyltransferase [Paenibacillus curdlanolyticus]
MTAHRLDLPFTDLIAQTDREVSDLIQAETTRQKTSITLIPSENYSSVAVQLALASVFTNKYSEGYPYLRSKDNPEEIDLTKNGRYYQGQPITNELERLAIRRTLELFTPNPDDYHANVQAHSGSPANLAVLSGLLEIGDTLMGLSLDYGGHLTHGHDVNMTGKMYNVVKYHLNDNYEIDYNEIETKALEHRPKAIICGATAYPRQIDFERLGQIAKQSGAYLIADISHIAGLCTAGVHQHPFPHADVVTSTTHKILRGPRAAVIICKKELGKQIDKALFPGLQGGPHMNNIAGLAIAFKEAMSPEYKEYARQIVKNARALADQLKLSGFKLMGDGTDNHLILMDVVNSSPELSVKHGAYLATKLEEAGIVTNKNSIPGDDKPWYPSGIRMGTPAVTTLGMKEKEMVQIASWIVEATKHAEDSSRLAEIKNQVANFMKDYQHPNYFIH